MTESRGCPSYGDTHIVWTHTFLGSVWLSLRNINIVSAVAQHLSELLFARCMWHCVPPRLWLSVFISVSDVQMHTHDTASMGKTRFTWEKPYHFIVKSNALVMRLMLSCPKQTWASQIFLAFTWLQTTPCGKKQLLLTWCCEITQDSNQLKTTTKQYYIDPNLLLHKLDDWTQKQLDETSFITFASEYNSKTNWNRKWNCPQFDTSLTSQKILH